MGLGRSEGRRFPVPHEDGQWFAFQRLAAVELDRRTAAGGDLCADGWLTATMGERFALCLLWLETCLTGWSYAELVNAENLARLDAPTLLWAYQKAVSHNYGLETPEEKKADSPSSTPISTTNPEPAVPMRG